MRLQKRTYSIEDDILKAFEQAVATGNRSVIVTDLLRKYVAEKERAEIRAALIAGAPLVNEEYREEANAWYPLG